ncbi:MAG: protease inhibitor I42 family protein [Bacteroidales bacterium]|nr:protease inhibitor I42 family protein [Bacteroidales bacterium]
MRQKLIVLFLALIFSLSFYSCSGPYTVEDDGRTIELGIDDPFEIELDGNPTTGYIWDILSYDSTIIKQIGKADYQAISDAIGAGGKYTFKFQTIAAGSTILQLIYYRSFEKNVPPAKTFQMKIISGTMGRIEAE